METSHLSAKLTPVAASFREVDHARFLAFLRQEIVQGFGGNFGAYSGAYMRFRKNKLQLFPARALIIYLILNA